MSKMREHQCKLATQNKRMAEMKAGNEILARLLTSFREINDYLWAELAKELGQDEQELRVERAKRFAAAGNKDEVLERILKNAAENPSPKSIKAWMEN